MPDKVATASLARPPIPPLTSLRFFAAALVVIFHYNANRFTRLPDFIRSWLETGYEAVTFFFLLSGFVLAYVYYRDDADGGPAIRNLPSFYAARIGRLLPALYAGLLLAVPFFLFPGAFYAGDKPEGNWPLEAFMVLIGFQSWFPSMALAWNPPAWSVSVELSMYLIFPLILLVMRHISASTMLVSAYFLLVAVSVFRVWLMLPPAEEGQYEVWHNFTHYWPPFHFPTFIFGAALGRVHLVSNRMPSAGAAWMFAAGGIGLMILLYEVESLPLHVRSSAILATFFALVIYGASQPGHAAYRWLSLPPLVYLGEISYSMYALHQPIENWWDIIGPNNFGWRLPPVVDFLLLFAVVLVASALCYRFIEVPMRDKIRSLVRARR